MAQRSRLLFATRRLVSTVPVLLGVIVAVFLLTRMLPGDPVAFFAGAPGAGPKEMAEVRQRLGLDKTLPEQFVIYLEGLARGDLGQSLLTGRPVADDLVSRLPASLELTVVALLLAVGIAVPLGVCRRDPSGIDG